MKITTSRAALAGALDAVAPAVDAHAARNRPVLGCVKFAAEPPDALTLTATNLDVTARYSVPGVEVGRPGEVLLNLADLAAVLREVGESAAGLEAGKKGATLRCDGGRFDLVAGKADEFPDPRSEPASPLALDTTAGELRRALRRVRFAAARQDTTGGRFGLTGVLFESDGKSLTLAATDTYRMSVAAVALTSHGGGNPTSALLPGKLLDAAAGVFGSDDQTVKVELAHHEAAFRRGDSWVRGRLVEGRLPPYREIIAQTAKRARHKFDLPVGGFLARLRAAAAVADRGEGRVVCEFSGPAANSAAGGKLVITARGPRGSSDVEMALPGYSGAELSVAFDPHKLTDFLRAADADGCESAAVEVVDPLKPVLLSPADGWQFAIVPLADPEAAAEEAAA